MFICVIVFPIKLIGISFLISSVYAVSIRSANVDMVHPLWRASFSSFSFVVRLVRLVMTTVFFSFMTHSLITRYTYLLDFSTLTLYTLYTLRRDSNLSKGIRSVPVRFRVVSRFVSGVDWRCRIKAFDSLEDAIEYLRHRVLNPSERTFQIHLSVAFEKNKK